MIESLDTAVRNHAGQFICVEINKDQNTKTVPFRHAADPPVAQSMLPNVPGLSAFYSTFGSLTLFLDDESGESAFFIADPIQWERLRGDFELWLEGMGEDEIAESLPEGVTEYLVVGEIPRSGNYLLVSSTGTRAGLVFEFEHDGYEFIELGASLPEFVAKTLDLDAHRLTNIASHLRFILPNEKRQWWIRELQDNRGNIIRTDV